MKKRQESRMRMEALIPYMRQIGKKEMADLANQAINCTTMEEVVALVEKVVKK